jgi:tetratricopeptide (TPR) repeat protein
MKTSFEVALFIFCLSITSFGQQAKLEGHVFDEKDIAISSARIVAAGGQAAVTDHKGHFIIRFPASIQPGQATRIQVVKSNWVIFQPMFGNCVTQSTERNYEPLRVVIVRKGSPLALAPRRLSHVIAQWSGEIAKLRTEIGSLKLHLDEYAYLRQYAEEYGFTLEEFRAATEQWAQIKDSDDNEERALKEYWQKNYGKAAQLATESAKVADEELRQAIQKTNEVSLKVIRRYQLAGSAYYAQYKFREALTAYGQIVKLFETGTLSRQTFRMEWAETQLLLGNAKGELGRRIKGEEGPRLLKESLAEYQQSLSFYTPAQSPEYWAGAQNNLGIALVNLGKRANGPEGIKYLNGAFSAKRAARDVRTPAQFHQEGAAPPNNVAAPS